jgi:hypothetical protein
MLLSDAARVLGVLTAISFISVVLVRFAPSMPRAIGEAIASMF